MIAAIIVGYDDAALLRGCLDSLAPFGWPALYLDGAWSLYPARDWRSPAPELAAVLEGREVIALPARAEGPWSSEAEKRSVALAEAWDKRLHLREPKWYLWLDADERVEGDPAAVMADLTSHPEALWANVNIYRPDHVWAPAGFWLPRLLRAHPLLRHEPPTDYRVYRGAERIAYLDGEAVPPSMVGRYHHVPTSALRLRHERGQRPAARANDNGFYQRARRARYGTA